jgi:hypothetical protein
MFPEASTWDQDIRPSSVLARLHSILTAFKDSGNNSLVDILYQKMARAQSLSSTTVPRSLRGLNPTQKRKAECRTIPRSSNTDWNSFNETNSQPSILGRTTSSVAQQTRTDTGFDEDSLDEHRMVAQAQSILSDILVTPSSSQQDFEGLLTYGLPYVPAEFTVPHPLNTSTELTTPLIDQSPLDMVLNNLLFDNGDQPFLDTYWPSDNTPEISGLPQQS